MNSIALGDKARNVTARPPLQAQRLLDQLRERLRYLHYSLRTAQTYLYWTRWFIRFHGLRHPRDLGKPEVEAFLTMLANERKVSVSTHRQALSALLVLYKEVLGLRVKDVDFERQVIVVREGKGGKDRVVMLPQSLRSALRDQLKKSRVLWESDRAAQRPGVYLLHALEAKYPRAGQTWAWHWVFPSPVISVDPRCSIERRHHLYEERLQRALKKVLPLADIHKPVSVHTLRHSFATHLLQAGRIYAPCRSCWGTVT